MTVIENPLQMPEALCRTRTDDPFLTMVGALSNTVASGPTGSPEVAPQPACEDRSGPPERPQDAPTRDGIIWGPDELHHWDECRLEKLRRLAVALGDWSDPDLMPEVDPPGDCDAGDCDAPATAWRWADDLGGWIPVCAWHEECIDTFCCEACGGMFEVEGGWDAQAEASAVFRPEELDGAAIVCETCWRAMRAAMPDMDARYREQGL